jgi:hypothetical protein
VSRRVHAAKAGKGIGNGIGLRAKTGLPLYCGKACAAPDLPGAKQGF